MSTASGQAAESRAAEHLEKLGYRILERNWRTRYCEIDIVAQKDKVIWFVEVKYRRTSSQGYGYEYVTQKKLQQMEFAANMWTQDNDWIGDYRLAVISVDDDKIALLDEL